MSDYNNRTPYEYNGETAPKKKKNGRAAALVAIVMALMLVSGLAGGVAGYLAAGIFPAYQAAQRPSARDDAQDAWQPAGGGADVESDALAEFLKTASLLTLGEETSGNKAGFIDVVKKTMPSVVEITTEVAGFNSFMGQYITSGAGSGVILTQDGYIVTNHHVIEDASSITVRIYDGKEYKATLVGTDKQTDLAVLKIDATGLTPAKLGDSDTLEVGELAIAIGNPLGQLGGTVTTGIISAKDRDITIDNQTMKLLQTSAAINPGNSGGGLFDQFGNLVGVVNAKSSGTGIEGLGFAIPSNTVRFVVDELIRNGYVTGRPQMGINVIDITSTRMASMYGVSQVGVYVAQPGSTSLKSGDRLISIDGRPITASSDISRILADKKVGDVVSVKAARENNEVTVSITLTEQKPEVSSSPAQTLQGSATM